MSKHIENREQIIERLQRELVGPDPQGERLDCEGDVSFDKKEDAYGPWRREENGEEILVLDPPTRRYGAGVLYPPEISVEKEEKAESDSLEEVEKESGQSPEEASSSFEELSTEEMSEESPSDDLDLSLANAYRPSSMAISFLADVAESSKLEVSVTGARYREKSVSVAGTKRLWWIREPFSIEQSFSGTKLNGSERRAQRRLVGIGNDRMAELRVLSRPRDPASRRLLTVAVTNKTPGHVQGRMSSLAFFQVELTASVENESGEPSIRPYPSSEYDVADPGEMSMELLYRGLPTFGVGHGCAANWQSNRNSSRATSVTAEALPCVEVPSVTPEITLPDGNRLRIDMANLAGLRSNDEGWEDLTSLVDRYEGWIRDKGTEAEGLPEDLSERAFAHLESCEEAADRMRRGIKYLQDNPLAERAFRLANHAILLQQIQSAREPRKADIDRSSGRLTFSEPYSAPDPFDRPEERGAWRPFQIAFILAALPSTAEGDDPERELVDLMWFPTGGGKTEAYLGLIAFSVFLRRLRDPTDAGVEAIMRYTLRLLTTQQFQRATRLLCAMDIIRRKRPSALGETPFSVGIWVGKKMTPNRRADAKKIQRKLARGEKTQNKFVLRHCPWCQAEIGPTRDFEGRSSDLPNVLGYEERADSVALSCSDKSCPFSKPRRIPAYVIDEDIYRERPDLVVGTIDKFAMLAWRPSARGMFGIDESGERTCSPPGLIIQDELHLIAGPLGSIAGLYETVIEELCTDRRRGEGVPPKIVCSTATIRTHEEQIRALYAREEARLFPPPGIDAGDSFFARYARDDDGELKPGKKYLGVHAPGLGSSMDAQARVLAALLQAPNSLSAEEQDPWWTNVVFFNSLRELGTTLSQLQSYIPGYLQEMARRTASDNGRVDIRWPRRPMELTGRLSDEQVPEALDDLEVHTKSDDDRPVDVCLASSIIEVGVDVDRLSLMTVISQPKTTAQYIQVTGRIGRKWRERPGLVTTVFSPTRPRDRSHYEKFRSYHDRLYAQVEPTSVTPFSEPVLRRALSGVIAIFIRQTGDSGQAESPYPVPEEKLNELESLLERRVRVVDPEESSTLSKVFDQHRKEWKRYEPIEWSSRSREDDPPLLYRAGKHVPRRWESSSWSTPMSMRTVDAECLASVTRIYLEKDEGAA